MTASEDRDDHSVLDSLGFGFGAPAALDAGEAVPAALEAPASRRELRERERSAVASRGGRGASTGPKKRVTQPKVRRAPKNTTRREAVRVAGRKKTIGARLLSFGAMLFAGALAIGMTVPANAFNFAPANPQLADTMTAMSAQSIDVDPTLASFSERDDWTVTSWAEMLRLRYGNRSFDYTVGSGAIRWPFPAAVPISSGFGDRAAPCRGCSTSHSGIDFNPGAGAAIFAIADGVVVEHQDGHGSWGNYVVIRHTIDGQTVFSGYAHMQSASSPLAVGEEIRVGDFVGLVGATGQATGAHLHFTISIGEQNHFVDPFTFLKTYAS